MKLLLTLGHNASAILVDQRKVLCGYEEERLSKVKSDSSYPILAIEEIIKYFPQCTRLVTDICVSHWFWVNGTNHEESKYWKPKHLKARFKNAETYLVNEIFTHHDAHANSVWNFSETKSGLTIVADGFGTNGETLSVYRDGELINRKFDVSLGLMYQNMTTHLGMKANQDEYKILGMESHIVDNVKQDIVAFNYASIMFDRIINSNKTDYSSVEGVLDYNKKLSDHLCLNLMVGFNEYEKAYTVQKILELVVVTLIEDYIEDDDFLQFSGGIFYNVKLNNKILNSYANRVKCIEFMPLCGDQGAALGMTEVLIDDLFWGKRDILQHQVTNNGLTFVVKGDMEFGPRALGNTSCIAAPTVKNTELINKLNGRPNIMPMAPMITPELASKYCKHISVLGKCKHYMICATDWMGPIDEFRGVLHRKPCSDTYTCRPQVVSNEFTRERGVVINTSLNAHGQPIILSSYDYEDMEQIHDSNS